MRAYAQEPYADAGEGVVLCRGVPWAEVKGHPDRRRYLWTYGACLGSGSSLLIPIRPSATAGARPRATTRSWFRPSRLLSGWRGLNR